MKENKTDKSVKQYQEDIKAGVEVGTEQIRCEHNVVKKYCFNCKFTDKYGLKIEMFNNHHYVRLKAVDKLLSEQRQSILEEVEKLIEVNLAKIPPQLEDRGYQEALDTVISIIKSK